MRMQKPPNLDVFQNFQTLNDPKNKACGLLPGDQEVALFDEDVDAGQPSGSRSTRRKGKAFEAAEGHPAWVTVELQHLGQLRILRATKTIVAELKSDLSRPSRAYTKTGKYAKKEYDASQSIADDE